MEYRMLSNNVAIPMVGFGTFSINNEYLIKHSIETALTTGYRSIDTASIYGNEAWIGEELSQSRIPRENLFITSKVWNHITTYNGTIEAFEESLLNLDTNYLDLYLIHWPAEGYQEKWRALETLYKSGKIKAIGVSNFEEEHLLTLFKTAEIKPMIDQLETHPHFPQRRLNNFLNQYGIRHESWSPLGRGQKQLLNSSILKKIADKYHKTVPQIILRWHIDRGLIIIPKSTHPARIKENFELFDFSLTIDEIAAINFLETDSRVDNSPLDQHFLAESAQDKFFQQRMEMIKKENQSY
ncbi:aldo/keto reductase [Enterococcus faecalis]